MNLKEYIDWVLNKKIDGQKIASEYFEKAKKSISEKENIYLRINNEELRINNEGVQVGSYVKLDNDT